VPEGLPQDKSPSKHASFRWLGKPDKNHRYQRWFVCRIKSYQLFFRR
ncbi:Ivy family c-type lysozyme inhibitor, partial [Pseudomonas aeruginosa]